ncbi:hypothetical protein AVEN_245642-1 [Araneus ventricosus]|uniref:Uncharacterized protein n=1 Tax=Araneus ventricosus TaxID=182803 RepID=A0A4Y2P225_ARAVE|nr:hypothetical protein AVEN_245642-1 [Araneus ventricosus]
MVMAGPTRCGKTYFVRNLLHYKTEMFSPVPDKIVWFYGIHQPLYDGNPEVTFVEGLPLKFQEYLGKHTLFIIDVLMSHGANQKLLTDLFTKEHLVSKHTVSDRQLNDLDKNMLNILNSSLEEHENVKQYYAFLQKKMYTEEYNLPWKPPEEPPFLNNTEVEPMLP